MESADLVLGTTSWSFPSMNVWVDRPFVQGGKMACGGDVRTSVGGVVVGETSKEPVHTRPNLGATHCQRSDTNHT